MSDTDESETSRKPRPVGINHVALEVGDVDRAVAFYRDVFDWELRGETATGAFLDMGDQFLALSETDDTATGDHAHFGLVVDDAARVEDRLAELGIDRLDTRGLEFRDPWGNRVQVVEYAEVQFTKAPHVREGMGFDGAKSEDALAELAAKGMAPDE